MIQLRDPLDEPEYYCVDVPGFGRSLNLEGALTAHTCKPNADDELFIYRSPIHQAKSIWTPMIFVCRLSIQWPGLDFNSKRALIHPYNTLRILKMAPFVCRLPMRRRRYVWLLPPAKVSQREGQVICGVI